MVGQQRGELLVGAVGADDGDAELRRVDDLVDDALEVFEGVGRTRGAW
ncbi:MAG TPA: hypothetical protein VGR43_03030 [Dehalococcoidia bacterium]|jgi:hypothetical protein|nr:hypothetical protein [Dehalococcoidia bacterium]